jgi:hypothetical protein
VGTEPQPGVDVVGEHGYIVRKAHAQRVAAWAPARQNGFGARG